MMKRLHNLALDFYLRVPLGEQYTLMLDQLSPWLQPQSNHPLARPQAQMSPVLELARFLERDRMAIQTVGYR